MPSARGQRRQVLLSAVAGAAGGRAGRRGPRRRALRGDREAGARRAHGANGHAVAPFGRVPAPMHRRRAARAAWGSAGTG